MFFALPIRDEPNPPGRAWATWGLMAANVAAWLFISWPLIGSPVDPRDPVVTEYLRLMAAETGIHPGVLIRQLDAFGIFNFQYGFKPADPSAVTLLTSMFMHGGWLHLGGNMLFLWIFGDNVEFELGRVRYLFAYLAMGAVATVTFAVFDLDSFRPMVGASGAISGVLGCYFLWFPRNRVKVLTVFIWFINVLNLPARVVLGFYILVSNILPFLFATESGVAYGAHIGGFFGGLGLAWLHMRRGQVEAGVQARLGRRAPSPARERSINPSERSSTHVFERAVEAASWEQAVREYALMPAAERSRLLPGSVFALAAWMTDQGHHAKALGVMQSFIATRPNSPVLAAAHLRAGLILLRGVGRPTAAYQHLLAVLDLEPTAEEARIAREGLAQIEESRRRRVFH